ncbi:hypothetical protein HU200_001951 [Digitaria exilis]|uniref:Uncharacterized protein n=1 Tax=Digitaria exilis TaxID=1010633 RepID=A0A835FZP1_9POAL|nr:hypothetical protein HU200_001951 [Digitaria exilis]
MPPIPSKRHARGKETKRGKQAKRRKQLRHLPVAFPSLPSFLLGWVGFLPPHAASPFHTCSAQLSSAQLRSCPPPTPPSPPLNTIPPPPPVALTSNRPSSSASAQAQQITLGSPTEQSLRRGMSASPEFYKPTPPASMSPASLSPLPQQLQDYDYDYGCCRTPTGSGISYLKEPTTCPPAPRKPPLCKKRLFHLQQQQQQQQEEVISLRLDDLERIFRPRQQQQQPKPADKRRRSSTDLPTSTGRIKNQLIGLDNGFNTS